MPVVNFSKAVEINVCGSKDGFVRIETGACVVIVTCRTLTSACAISEQIKVTHKIGLTGDIPVLQTSVMESCSTNAHCNHEPRTAAVSETSRRIVLVPDPVHGR